MQLRSFLLLTSAALPGVRGVRRGLEYATILTRDNRPSESYDYIVVGGGTSGLTVADRLTEDGKTTVLVVEYGELGTKLISFEIQLSMLSLGS